MGQDARTHSKNHGLDYLVLYSDGYSGNSFTMKYNDYEFNSPYGQAFHEANVVCERDNRKLHSIYTIPLKENNPYIRL